MPYLKIQTNLQVDTETTQAFLQKASVTIAKLLNKPEKYVMLILQTEQPMLFAGTTGPVAYLELKSIGLPKDRTRVFSQTLCELVSEQLGITAERIYIEFADAQRALWGWNKGTF